MLFLLNVLSLASLALWWVGSRWSGRRLGMVSRVAAVGVSATGVVLATVGLIRGSGDPFALVFMEISFGVAVILLLSILLRGRPPQMNWDGLLSRLPRRFPYGSRFVAVLVGLGAFAVLQGLIFVVSRLAS